MQPSPDEVQDMSKRAALVVRLMDDLRRLSLPEDQMPKDLPIPNGAIEEHRPPKRPWEDTVDENTSPNGGDRGEVRLLTWYNLRVCYELTPYTTSTPTISCNRPRNRIWRSSVASGPPAQAETLLDNLRASIGSGVYVFSHTCAS